MTELKPCPFCGRKPKVIQRPDSLDGYFCAISCFCGGYSARAHQAATGKDNAEAFEKASSRWNRRNAPVKEVVYGEWVWIPVSDHEHILACSDCCGTNNAAEDANFCPNCGADMRGVE